MVYLSNTENFILKAIEKHGSKFDYTHVFYLKAKSKVKIICPTHGIFEQTPNDHLNGRGCPKCSGKNKTTDEFICEVKKIHGDRYDYSLVKYINNRNKIKIICKVHGIFEQTPSEHLFGYGCKKCGNIESTNKRSLNLLNLKDKIKIIHGNKYEYDFHGYVNSRSIIKIKCGKHGIFKQVVHNHLIGQGCPICNESKGEREISNYLTNYNINYIRQYKFPDCKDKRPLPFDFYLPDYNICVEFDGEQHFKRFHFEKNDIALEIRIIRDNMKTKYCEDNNILLLRIKHGENIKKKISNYLLNINK